MLLVATIGYANQKSCGTEMMKKVPLRKRIDVILNVQRASTERALKGGVKKGHAKPRINKKLVKILMRATAKAFEKAGLDVDSDDDWKTLAALLSAAAFGGRDRGQPKKWSKKKLRRLVVDVANIQAKHPTFSEENCCKELIRESGGEYNKVSNAETLRRVLQTAKLQSSLSSQIASLKSAPIVAGVSKILKGKF